MRRFAFAITVSLFASLLISPTNAAIKAGSICPKLGATSLQSGKKFTCIKSGKKLVWNKGVLVAKPVPTPSLTPTAIATPTPTATPTPSASPSPVAFEFTSFCEKDPEVPAEWKVFQDNVGKRCAPPYRYVTQLLTSVTPNTSLTDKSKLLPISSCKLKRSEGFKYELDKGYKLNPNLSVIILPFATADFPTSNDPIQDWGSYFSWIKKSIENMSDVPTNLKFDIAPRYFEIKSKITEFNLGGSISHGDPSATDRRYKLIREIVAAADPAVDFSKYDYIFTVSPRNISRDVLSNQIAYGQEIVTNEKKFNTSSYVTSYIDDFKSQYWIEREPFGFMHEMMHLFGTADDYYGDIDHGGNDLGAGNWGNMSGAQTDHFVWDKWTAKLIYDSQVICASPNESSVHWIKPSTITGVHEKLLLIPLSEYEAIGVESIRNSGFNYKIPKAQLGAIVYLVNTKLMDDNSSFGDGLKVYCPTNRPCTREQDYKYGGFRLSLAALKPGDFVELKGMRVSVVEAGDFGDVVKVEKL